MSAYEQSPAGRAEGSGETSSSKPTSESTSGGASRFNREFSGDTSQDAAGASSGAGDIGKGRKRRAVGSVSLMACTPCRQARQKVSINRVEEGGFHHLISLSSDSDIFRLTSLLFLF